MSKASSITFCREGDRTALPSGHGLEASGAAIRVRAIGDVVQSPRMLVEDRVDESDGAFAGEGA